MEIDMLKIVTACLVLLVVPLFVDFMPVGNGKRLAARWVSFLIWGLMGVIFLLCLYSMFYDMIPFFFGLDAHSTIGGVSLSLFSLWLWVNTVTNYYEASTLSAGPITNKILESLPENTLICQKCNKKRPSNAKHCHYCGVCTIDHDHHCPYTGNCVGRRNYLYFWLFIMYFTLGTLWASFVTFFPFKICVIDRIMLEREITETAQCNVLGRKVLLFIPVLLSFFATGFLFSFQTLLLISRRTTADYWRAVGAKCSGSGVGQGFLEFFRFIWKSMKDQENFDVNRVGGFKEKILLGGRVKFHQLLLPYPPELFLAQQSEQQKALAAKQS